MGPALNNDNRNNDTILSARDIQREFSTAEGKLPVLKGITFTVKRGKMIAMTGASGVGKSTLLHILGGLDRPTQGEVYIDGTPLGKQNERFLAKFRNEKIGFVFQHHYLLDDFTALENVMIPQLLSGAPRSAARERGELLLREVGLSNRRSHRPRELSGGEQQRVAVARALANDPEVVLADEPSGNLDTATGEKLHHLLCDLNSREQTSFVIATHNRQLARACHHEYVIRDGRLAE